MIRTFKMALILSVTLSLTSCASIVGIPSHGGGKRFATEQRLISASARAALKDIDVRALRGKRVVLLYEIIGDTGAGNMSGGRLSLSALIQAASVFSPITTTASKFQVVDLAGSGTNVSNSASSGSSTAIISNISNSVGTSTNTQSSSSSGSTTSSSSSGTVTDPVTTTQSSTTDASSESSGEIDITTGGTNSSETNSSETESSSSTNTNSTTGATNTNTTASGSASSSSNTTGNSSSSNSSSATTDSNSNTNETTVNTTENSSDSTQQAITPQPTHSEQKTKGESGSISAGVQYNGLGTYQNSAITVSDVNLLFALIRGYLLLNGVADVSKYPDANSDAIVYVTVDIFGTIRKRFDMLVYNKETLIAETGLEMYAFDGAYTLN